MNSITSKNNEKIKYLRSLYNRQLRKREGKFILEGYRLIEEAIKAKAKIETIFMTTKFASSNEGKDIIKKIVDLEKITLIDNKLLKKLADTESPQGVIAIGKKVDYKLDDFFQDAQIILVLDQIQDPGNMGTMVRTAVAAGVDGIIALKGCVDFYNLKVLRSSMGAIFNIPFLTGIDLEQFRGIILKNGRDFKIVSAALSGDRYYYELNYCEPIFLVIGNEAHGIRDELLEISDWVVKIPILGQIDSLNAAIASGIILYEIVLKRKLIRQ